MARNSIYGLAPLWAGPVDRWADQIARIADMGFDWIAVETWHPVDADGALLDTGVLHPALRPSESDAAAALTAFVAAAGKASLQVMIELDLFERSAAAALVAERPELFEPPVGTPGGPAPDPRFRRGPPRRFAWGHPAVRKALETDAHELLDSYRALGVTGFRCRAAHRVPAELWRDLMGNARKAGPALFVADVLGAEPAAVRPLDDLGFDLATSSLRWWDFAGDWLIDEIARLAPVGGLLTFPEGWTGQRLAAQLDGPPDRLEREVRLRAQLAAGLGSGFFVPMGFEYGFRQAYAPAEARADAWRSPGEELPYDLTGFLAELNHMRAAAPVFAARPAPIRVSAPGRAPVAFARLAEGTVAASPEACLVVANPDPSDAHGVDPGPLITATGGYDLWQDVAADGGGPVLEAGGPSTLATLTLAPLTLAPLAARVFRGQRSAFVPKPATSKAARARLEKLAEDRIAIEGVTPELDGGRFPVKRVVGDVLEVEADIFGDGHDVIAAVLAFSDPGPDVWHETPMRPLDNDRWAGSVPLRRVGRARYTILAWRDLFAAWRRDILKKIDAGLVVSLETTEGRQLVDGALREAGAEGKPALLELAQRIEGLRDEGAVLDLLLSAETSALMARFGPRSNLSRYGKELAVTVDAPLAAFAAWYEVFPRSQTGDPTRHGTFADVEARLPAIRDMGFDVLYFPPIHPIGSANRKGRNNTLTPGADDPGSPYAIGAPDGGHRAIHADLGDFDSFAHLVAAARDHGLEIALDFAIQCSPDHPWIAAHADWFDWRPDGTIKYAENPPKKYQDIVNVHFYRKALPDLWYELRDTILFWVEHGVRIFRVDNPHTKPFPFWEWCIREVQDRHPDTIFLAEAFTRPKVMARLAKVGFTQSYSYFTWRNTKAELIEYLTGLTQGPSAEFMRPNFFVNTPDINPPFLQNGGRPAHLVRLVLAATLAGVYGVYEPFVVCEATPLPGREEYLDSEKYEMRAWDLDRPGNIKDEITLLNRLRRDNPALRQFSDLEFLNAWNDNILAYVKMTAAHDNAVLVAVNLDPFHAQEAAFEVPLWRFALPDHAGVDVEDLVTGARFAWQGKMQHLRLDPAVRPFAIWRLTA